MLPPGPLHARTQDRFPRRLIEERRIRYVKVGRHVRIPESAIEEFVRARTVEPLKPRRAALRRAA
ncbi:excisionase family DNA-binding protein [Streptomyces collinus]|uniref:excisionase family DNA-binding protein n=1 Tax=Streptomyces collinus TaxID=42684 RepID=UPI00364E8155